MGDKQKRVTPQLLLMALSALLIVFAGATWLWNQPSHASPAADTIRNSPEPGPELSQSDQGTLEIYTLFLPVVVQTYPPPPPIYGTQMIAIPAAGSTNLAVQAGIHWVRFDALDWDEIEPVRHAVPTYDWSTVNEEGLRNAAQNGLTVIGTVRYTPEWAQKVPGYACGPIAPEALDEFAQFLTAAVQRYSTPPFNIHYWELGNEPDIDPSLLPNPRLIGCWGDEDDPYYGGGYYAQMLQVAYPAIKAADPTAQVLIGGLLLDCDPTNPPPGKDCKPAKFLEGILLGGGADYFDIVNFHGYPQYNGSLQLDEHWPSWAVRGGVVLGKIDFLRSVLAAYQVQKPIFHSEGSLICPENVPQHCAVGEPPHPTDAFFEAQADYAVWLYIRNWAEGLLGTTWFTWQGPGWRYGSMLDEYQQPRLAYDALSFLSTELQSAYYQQPVTQYPGLRVYQFQGVGKRIWVMWAPDEQPHTIHLPANTQRVLDKYGNVLPTPGGMLTVQRPVYVELSQQ